MNIPLLAGTVSTVLFAASMLPMLLKAVRTKDVASYSLGNIALTNIANAVHSFYVFDLPAGPVWLLHAFYVVASALMLAWCLRYRKTPEAGPSEVHEASPAEVHIPHGVH
ncbi:hypothetical protein WBN73_02480 [Paenarthrobacter sp. CCNWLY172]|uniref:hypothetical protein n=1 Tax=unclassified Paenarthrobacter TaxID=2634190 RepID=UPI003078644D